MTITTTDTDGRPVTLITHIEADGRITLCVTIGNKNRPAKHLVTSLSHLSATDSTALRGALRPTPLDDLALDGDDTAGFEDDRRGAAHLHDDDSDLEPRS